MAKYVANLSRMHHKVFSKYAIPAVVIALSLSACSESDDEGVSTATARAGAGLENHQDALLAASYLLTSDALDKAVNGFRDTRAPNISSAKLELNGAACAGGGEFDFDDKNRDDFLMYEYRSCVDDAGVQRHGRLELECASGTYNDESDPCVRNLIEFGGLQLSGQGQATLRLDGNYEVRNTATAEITTHNLQIRSKNAAGDAEFILVLDNFERRLEGEDGGSAQLFVNGDIGADFEGETLECGKGSVNFLTRNALQLDANGNINGGEVLLTNDEQQEAVVDFSADGGASVSINGSTMTFPAEEVRSLCQFD